MATNSDWVSIDALARERDMNPKTLARAVLAANDQLHGTLAVQVGKGTRKHWRVRRAAFDGLGIGGRAARDTVSTAEHRRLASVVEELRERLDAAESRIADLIHGDRPSASRLRTA